ncbi:MAG: hypothetical protein GY771_01895 [bacterium]|nr:hypothetical protein [bacterium]
MGKSPRLSGIINKIKTYTDKAQLTETAETTIPLSFFLATTNEINAGSALAIKKNKKITVTLREKQSQTIGGLKFKDLQTTIRRNMSNMARKLDSISEKET